MEPDPLDWTTDCCVFILDGVTFQQLCLAYETAAEANCDAADLNAALWASQRLNELINQI